MLNISKIKTRSIHFSITAGSLFCFMILTLITTSVNADTVTEKDNAKNDYKQVYLSAKPSQLESLAALEIQRYVYLRTDTFISIIHRPHPNYPITRGILVAQKDSPLLSEPLIDQATLKTIKELGKQEYRLKTIHTAQNHFLLICGGDALGTLYGA